MQVPTSRSRKKIYASMLDVSWILLSPAIALYAVNSLALTHQDWSVLGIYYALSVSFSIVAFLAFRLGDSISSHFSAHEALDIAEAVLFAGLLTCGVMFTLTRLDGIPRSMPLYHGLLLAAGLILVRIATRGALNQGDSGVDYQFRGERMVIIGANRLASSFIRLLSAYAPNRQNVVAVLDEKSTMIGRALSGVQVLGTPQELDAIVGEFGLHGVKVGRVIIAGESDYISAAALHDVERVCKKRHLELSYLPRVLGLTKQAGLPLPMAREPSGEPVAQVGTYLRIKRLVDVVGSLVFMVLLLPIFVVATLLVLFDVGSPVLFWQERTGWKGQPFLVYKYRTLRAPFDDEGKPAVGDRQPSAIGRFLRATRIDELPQLINVLFGDMSLIGPRPLLPEDQPDNTALRLSVRPGVTGWAQVKGGKLVTKEEKKKLDEYYIRNASLWLDFKILLMTLRMIGNNFVGSVDASADLQQVQAKRTKLALTEAESDHEPAPKPRRVTSPVRNEVAERSA